MASLDVVNMYTNLNKKRILAAIEKRWIHLHNRINLSLTEFLEGISVFLDSTVFTFNNKFYRQLIGSPMGSCSSPMFGELIINSLEESCLNTLKNTVIFYRRYVDDTFIVFKDTDSDLVLNTFNSYDNDNLLRFTMENETENKLNFLDMSVIRVVDSFPLIDWYHKPTSTDRYLNFDSHHPVSMKKAIIYNLVDKAILLSNSRFHSKNLNYIQDSLLKNNFPIQFIKKHIKKRIFKIKQDTLNNNNNNNTNNNYDINNNNSRPLSTSFKRSIVLPFVKNLNPLLKNTLKKHNISLINSTANKLNNFIKLGKDKLNVLDNRHAVYKIQCNDCLANYVGQTGCSVSRRMMEHKYATSKQDVRSVIAMHCKEKGHPAAKK